MRSWAGPPSGRAHGPRGSGGKASMQRIVVLLIGLALHHHPIARELRMDGPCERPAPCGKVSRRVVGQRCKPCKGRATTRRGSRVSRDTKGRAALHGACLRRQCPRVCASGCVSFPRRELLRNQGMRRSGVTVVDGAQANERAHNRTGARLIAPNVWPATAYDAKSQPGVAACSITAKKPRCPRVMSTVSRWVTRVCYARHVSVLRGYQESPSTFTPVEPVCEPCSRSWRLGLAPLTRLWCARSPSRVGDASSAIQRSAPRSSTKASRGNPVPLWWE